MMTLEEIKVCQDLQRVHYEMMRLPGMTEKSGRLIADKMYEIIACVSAFSISRENVEVWIDIPKTVNQEKLPSFWMKWFC